MSEKKLTKGDRFNMFMRTNLQQASFNYERMHALGMCFDMVPAIKRLYDTKEEQVAALKRHLTFFNVTPAAVGPVLGVTAAMEEAKANGSHQNTAVVKLLERSKKAVEKNVKKLTDIKRDQGITFDKLGVDYMFVDEAHEFKNLYTYTAMSNMQVFLKLEVKKPVICI